MAERRIIVVGGGAAGLELATRLGQSDGCNVTMVDRRTTHLWKPLMHQLAAGTLDSYEDEIGFIAQARRGNFHYHIGYMHGLNANAKKIRLASLYDHEGREILPERELSYDELVLSVGSIANDFGTPGVADHSHFIDNPEGAESFRRDLTALLARTWAKPETGPVRLAIVGGGPTGVELAAEVMHAVEEVRGYGVDMPKPAIRVTLMEASERILAGVSEDIAEQSHQKLEEIGVTVRTGCRITGAQMEGLELDSELIDCDLSVWAAGVKAPAWVGELGLPTDKADRVLVDEYLRATGDVANIHAIGDCGACQEDGNGAPVPARAAAANQQASYLARRLVKQASERERTPFTYRDKGTLVSIAGYAAYGEIVGLKRNMVQGITAQLAYASLRRAHQRAILGSGRTLATMISDALRRKAKMKMKL